MNELDDKKLFKSLYDWLTDKGRKYSTLKSELLKKLSGDDGAAAAPLWTFHKGFDLGGKGDVQQISDWQSRHTLDSLKALIIEKGWSCVALRWGTAFCKKLDYQVEARHLNPVSDCDTWIYHRVGAGPSPTSSDLFDTALIEEHLANKVIQGKYLQS